jgi:hypothetical protein
MDEVSSLGQIRALKSTRENHARSFQKSREFPALTVALRTKNGHRNTKMPKSLSQALD